MADLTVDDTVQTVPVTYLKNYRVPEFLIDDVVLHFDLKDEYTLVTSNLKLRHNRLSGEKFIAEKKHQLKLDGDELILVSIKLDDKVLTSADYSLTENSLIILNVPAKFNLEIVTKIYPAKNTQLSGCNIGRIGTIP